MLDVIVHRQLLKSLETPKGQAIMNNDEISELASHINKRHRAAKSVQKDSSLLYQIFYFRARSNSEVRNPRTYALMRCLIVADG